MREIDVAIQTIVLSLMQKEDVPINIIEAVSDTILLLPDISKETEIGLLFMFNLIGNNINKLPKTNELFLIICNKYLNEYKLNILRKNQFSDIFNSIMNGGE